MKITSIEAVKIDYPPVDNPTRPRLREVSDLKPDPTLMGKYPAFRQSRQTWQPPGSRDVGCVVTAEDGTWGFGMTDLGRTTAAIIEDWFAPKLVGESVLATEKIYDLDGQDRLTHIGSGCCCLRHERSRSGSVGFERQAV